MLNQNEKSLLNFISCKHNCCNTENAILKTVLEMGIEVKIRDFNPIYQIIDELNFTNFKSSLIGK